MSALRYPSERTGSPPASSICIISDVPERGSPETIVIISAFQEMEIAEAGSTLRRIKNSVVEMIVGTWPPGKDEWLHPILFLRQRLGNYFVMSRNNIPTATTIGDRNS